MQISKYPEMELLLQDLMADIMTAFGEQLIGFYLFGSLVWVSTAHHQRR